MKQYWLEALLVAVLIGAATYSLYAAAPAIPVLDSVVGESVTVEGIVVRDPDVREGFVQLTLDVGEDGYILVRADNFLLYAYGDRLQARGKLGLPEPFLTDTGREFDYPKYLLAHGVTHTLSFARITILGHGEGDVVIGALIKTKHYFESGIKAALPEPESSLLSGLLLGDKRGLGEELTEYFRAAGLVHIIVLSGYNVALVINAIRSVLTLFLSRTLALTLSGVAALAFLLMTGVSETGLRATLMALVVLLAQGLHRPADGLRILLVVAAAISLWNPLLVLFDL